MMNGLSSDVMERMLESIYDAALAPSGWLTVLENLSSLFDAHFADLFTRSHDKTQYIGLACGLDQSDYQDQFLDTWFKRNIWGISKPVKISGEVLSTRQMVEVDDLKRTQIYADYLEPRGLHEGLRLAIWSDDYGIQDISLLRPWSAGAFDAKDIAVGQFLLPHLQRSAKIARRLAYAEAGTEGGFLALHAAGFGVMLLDASGYPVMLNGPAESLLREKDGLTLAGRHLAAQTGPANRALQHAIASALHPEALRRTARTVRLPRPSGGAPLVLMTLPLSRSAHAVMLPQPALLVLVTDPKAKGPSAAQLAEFFGLTDAEADLAAHLLAGFDLREISTRRGRSINTLRNQLAQLMNKTETARQAELIHRLRGIPAAPQINGPDGREKIFAG
ncbi:helix-turn-helix transcriptional regulator [Lichenifustis flavocetrariae]|uniref:Helix-turn-helix transcriptional regulator n=1 Tax=Lichenifustis flavocetrariae TaxID=2949735 RepID=A0AA41YT16_9HYPH|nr:helix-turn-helix transcriptional regulator [Lichenifustis flavocetrariae]MCW6506671.1 helix-turn-helix transcriptional regulator [Lichenifustis flavocetrariae]